MYLEFYITFYLFLIEYNLFLSRAVHVVKKTISKLLDYWKTFPEYGKKELVCNDEK